MSGPQPCLVSAFATAMDGLGPFEPCPALAVAVSGGADSLALAILARDWASQRDGSALALVVDHGLRPESADEARITIERLAGLGIAARLLPLSNLARGPALAERARIQRYAILAETCRESGILHLLLGHHAADQAETLAMRALRNSQTHGLAGMSPLRETPWLRLLRPLLGVQPAALRGFLAARGLAWVEDPSNQDRRALRARLRFGLSAHPDAQAALTAAIATAGQARAREEMATATELARRATIRPEGFAVLSPGRIAPAALSRLVRTIGSLPYPASPDQINDLAAQPRPATLAGVRIMKAGALGPGWLVVREEAAVMEPTAATPNTIWDRRFLVLGPCPGGATIGKLGPEAARFRRHSNLPSSVLRTLPAVRIGKVLAAVPHLRYVSHEHDAQVIVLFSPNVPVAGPWWLPTQQAGCPPAGQPGCASPPLDQRSA